MPGEVPSSERSSAFASAAKWSYVMDGGRQVTATLVTFLLARNLGPEVYGIAAIALAYVMFITMVQQQGLAAAIIQRADLRQAHLNTAFWSILAVSGALSFASIALSGWWARVNELPILQSVIIVLSAVLPLQALAIVQEALLRRTMDFRSLAIRTNVAVIGAGLTAVVLAWLGVGVWALVAQQLITAAIGLVLIWRFSDWRPSWSFSRHALGDLLGFSALSFVATVAVFIGNRSDALLIGVFFGPTAAGLYYFASRIVTMVTDLAAKALQATALPELSRNQHDLAVVADRMLSLLGTAALLAFPMLAMVAGLSGEIVGLVGEEDWGAAASVLRILTLVGAVRAVTFFTGPLLQSLGRPGQHARLSWVTALLSAGTFAATGYALRSSPLPDQVVGLAVARVGLHAVILVLYLAPIFRILGIKPPDVWKVCGSPLLAAVAGFIVAVLINQLLDGTPLLWRLVLEAAAAGLTMIALLVQFDTRARQFASSLTVLLRQGSG